MENVQLYIDESFTRRNALGDSWLYICTVAIRESQRDGILQELDQDRSDAQCESEFHFKEAKPAAKVDLGSRWLRRVHGSRNIRFHILGIHLNRLEHGFFGSSGAERDERIYSRFFRPAITWPLKAFFGAPVEVTAVYHDESALAAHPWFDWHSLWRIGKDHPDLRFRADRVRFINSDHRKETKFPRDSHFIQLADLLVATTRVCLDGGCSNKQKRGLALQNLDLLNRMMSGKRNIKSSYNYVDRKTISFFPSKAITAKATEEERARSSFYHSRQTLILEDQLTLNLFSA